MGLFKTAEREQVDFEGGFPDREGYTTIILKEAVDGEKYTGQPYLTQIYENDGDSGKYYKANLIINNDTKQETFKAPINFKSNDDEIKAFQKSGIFDIVDSLERINDPKTPECNKWTVSYEELQDYINSLEVVTVEIVENPPIKEGADYYNTLRFTKVS
jgi:hypothetical protein